MKLTGEQREQLYDELLASFDAGSLKRLLSFGLNKELRVISANNRFADIVFDVIKVSEKEGWVDELIRAAYQKRPHNKNLQLLAKQTLDIQQPIRANVSDSDTNLDSTESDTEVMGLLKSRRGCFYKSSSGSILGVAFSLLLLLGIVIWTGSYIYTDMVSTPTPPVIGLISPTPKPTFTAPPELTSKPVPESTFTATPEPTFTPTLEPRFTSTLEPTFTPTPEPTSEPTVESIQTIEDAIKYVKDKIVVGVVVDIPPIVEEQAVGVFEGFDINILNELISRWTGSVDSIEFRPVTISERISCVASGKCDLVISAITYTPERCSQQGAICSQVYFNDGARLLVRRDSGIRSIVDLDGKTIAVVEGSTGINNIQNLPHIIDYKVNPQIKIYSHVDRERAIRHVQMGVVDAYATDGIILKGYEDSMLEVVGEEFSEEPYVIAVNENHEGLKELIDLTIQAMKLDGTYDILFDELMDCRIPPLPIVTDYDTLDKYPDFVKSDSSQNQLRRCLYVSIPATHLIQEGETLGGLAVRYYGRFNFYRCIQDASNISNLLNIPAGKLLTIPSLQYCQENY